MRIEILKVEEKATSTGKMLKRCMMEVEGRQYPYKNVTVWEDCPVYREITPGYVIEGGYHIHVAPQKEKPDGSHINPHNNKPYNNYTLYQGDATTSGGGDLSERVASLEGRVAKLEGSPTGVDYPQGPNPEDIPF